MRYSRIIEEKRNAKIKRKVDLITQWSRMQLKSHGNLSEM
jgi:hypothetical protein